MSICLACRAFAHKLPSPARYNPTVTVTLTGLSGKALKNAQSRLKERQQALLTTFSTARLRQFYREIPKDIKSAIEPFGFFRARIRRLRRKQGDNYLIAVAVIPGPRLIFNRVDVRITGPGQQTRPFSHYYQHFPVKAGHYFDTTEYDHAKQGLFDIAAARGYFSAKMITSRIIVNLKNYTSHVIIHFATGPRYYFGHTMFSKTPFSRAFLQRFLRYRIHHPYNSHRLQKTRDGLVSSNYFQQVIITPEIKQGKHLLVPIKVTLVPQVKRTFTFGAGYGTDTGFRGLFGVHYNWLNARGHRFDALLRGSQVNSDLSATYIIPGHNPAHDEWRFTAGVANQDQVTGRGDSARAIISYATILGGWQTSLGLTLLNERYNLTDFPKTNTHLLYPYLSLQRFHSNNKLYPTHGYRLLFTAAAATQAIASKTSFSQFRLNTKFLFTIKNRLRFITRAELGLTSINSINNLPLSLQLFAGGAQSIRGFTFNSIGPGRNLAVGSFEVQLKTFGHFYLVGFIDAGNVSNNIYKEKLNIGTGPGIAFQSPIGIFELTVANAISSPNRPWVIQFYLGPVI